MELTQMRFKNFVWPHNPRTYTISFDRSVAVHKIPFGRSLVEDLGMKGRTLSGEGEFVGENAYEQFKALASLFYENSPGLLVHPVWQNAWAYFTDLSLMQEPRKDYVRYRFSFQEAYPFVENAIRNVTKQGGGAKESLLHTVAEGETLWGVAARYGVTVEDLLASNPAIKNPNLIRVGQKVVVTR